MEDRLQQALGLLRVAPAVSAGAAKELLVHVRLVGRLLNVILQVEQRLGPLVVRVLQVVPGDGGGAHDWGWEWRRHIRLLVVAEEGDLLHADHRAALLDQVLRCTEVPMRHRNLQRRPVQKADRLRVRLPAHQGLHERDVPERAGVVHRSEACFVRHEGRSAAVEELERVVPVPRGTHQQKPVAELLAVRHADIPPGLHRHRAADGRGVVQRAPAGAPCRSLLRLEEHSVRTTLDLELCNVVPNAQRFRPERCGVDRQNDAARRQPGVPALDVGAVALHVLLPLLNRLPLPLLPQLFRLCLLAEELLV
mmetsp:Transcript_26192/g.75538  ORF Transcript_26192/g.75538 Transcript_26192/m.75538 type:complete len:308 (-) Transcript_26192:1172-2095(-)